MNAGASPSGADSSAQKSFFSKEKWSSLFAGASIMKEKKFYMTDNCRKWSNYELIEKLIVWGRYYKTFYGRNKFRTVVS